MSERQLLDLLAQDAPVAGPNLADDVIHRSRQTHRRRWAVTLSSGAVAVIAVLPLLLAGGTGHSSHRTVVPAASTRPTAPSHISSTNALIYAAAMQHLPNPGVPGTPWRSIEILDHTCTNVSIALVGACNAQPIPADVQRDVLAALPKDPPVRFVTDTKLPVPTGGPSSSEFVTFGPIRISGDGAQVPVAVQCGFNCLQGETLVLAERGGAWTVTGTTGTAYMS